MKNFIFGLAALLVGITLGALVATKTAGEPAFGSAVDNINTVAVTTQYGIGPGVATQIAATSTGRMLMRIVSTSTTAYLKYGAAGTVANSEPYQEPLTFNFDQMYVGPVYAIASVSGTIAVTEFSRP